MIPLTQTELDQLAAQGGDCPRCTQHHADTWHPVTPCHPALNLCVPQYTKGSGVLKLACFICGAVVAEVAVAK